MTAAEDVTVECPTARISRPAHLGHAGRQHGRHVARNGTPPRERRPGESRPTATPERQSGGGRLMTPTPVDTPREESTVSVRAIAAIPSIVPAVGDRTVVITFHPLDPYGLVEVETTPDLSREALLEALEDTIRHLRIYTRGYRAEMIADLSRVRS